MWARVVAVVAGIWLMFAPAAFGYVDSQAADSDRIAGPIAAALAFVAAWAVGRPLRWGTVPLGVWLALGPWFLEGPVVAAVNSLVVGIVLVATGLVRGKVEGSYGGSWSSLTEPFPGMQGEGDDATVGR